MSDSRNQFSGTLLLIVTVAAAVAAVLSLRNLRSYPLHDDGVTWVNRSLPGGRTVVTAAYVVPGGPGANAGIHAGDQLVRIESFDIDTALDVPKALWRISVNFRARYTLRRNGIEFQKQNVFIRAAPRDTALYYQYVVGLAYLAIGLFVYFRRTSAAKSLHFYVLCLCSCIAYTFHYSGRLNGFDVLMYWGNVAAQLFAPAIFLHFCLTFHSPSRLLSDWRGRAVVYGPSAAILLLFVLAAQGVVRVSSSMLEVRWLLDRIAVGVPLVFYFAGIGVLSREFRQTEDPIVRRQLKYLRDGALVGITPFALLYALPYALGVVPSHFMSLSILSTGLLPLTWAYAITRYRLMDVDIIFQQGYVYTLATLAVIGAFYGFMFLIFDTQTIPPPAFIVLISFATFIFQPIRRWMQEQLDRWIFYRDRYDARLTLIAFARELSSETDQDAMLAKVSERLKRTLSIQRVGFFLRDDETDGFRLESLSAKSGRFGPVAAEEPQFLDLSFLPKSAEKPYLFFERPRHLHDIVSQSWPYTVRETIASLDFTYYVACKSRGKTVAFFGVTRTTEGDFLSSDDIELLVTVSNYVAIAIENSRLYSSVQRKADEYERLKEFSENIVESINVGVLAVGLDDRVESWNSQIEALTGTSRLEAIGRPLSDLFPPALVEKFDQARGYEGVHNIYKFALQPRNGNGTAPAVELSHPETSAGLSLATALPSPVSRRQESIVNLAIAPLVSKEGHQVGRLVIIDNITDRDDLERRLVQADKLSSIGLLAAGVAHEVNTPLAVISTYAQMLTKQVSSEDPKSKMLEKIAKQTFRASEIVNSLLNFSRTSPTEFVDVDLNRVIRETANLVEHQFERIGVGTHLELQDNLPVMRGNAGKLQQVFLNLFINARDAMPSGGSLDVKSWADAGYVHVEIADKGQGIPQEFLGRIYDPFFTTKGPKKGTGLGLSITYGIVQEHNGSIEVDSTPGQGTRFRLEFSSSSRSNQGGRKPDSHREAISA